LGGAPAPAQLGEVNQSIRAANVDKGAEVADRGNATLANLALAQLFDQLLLHLVALFLHGLALGEDQPVPMPVDLDDLQRQMRADHAGHFGLLASFVPTANFGDLRCRHKAATPSRFTSKPPLL